MGIVETSPNPRTGEKEVDRAGIQGHPQLRSKISLDYMRPMSQKGEKGKGKEEEEEEKEKEEKPARWPSR